MCMFIGSVQLVQTDACVVYNCWAGMSVVCMRVDGTVVVCVVALYGPELRDRRTIMASSSSSLSSQPSLHDVRHSSPSMHTKFSQQQPTSSGSEDSLSSLDKKSIFEFGSELRLEYLYSAVLLICPFVCWSRWWNIHHLYWCSSLMMLAQHMYKQEFDDLFFDFDFIKSTPKFDKMCFTKFDV